MNSRFKWFFRLSVAFMASLSGSPPASAAEPQWIEIQSPHFSVITDAGEKRGREAAMRFEQMRAVFSALLTKVDVNIPVPLQIVAFRNTKELRQIAPLWNGKPIELAGLFQGGEDRSFIMLDMSVDSPWIVVFHEYAHQLMNGTLAAEVDPWFEEGFAEYFSSIEVDAKEARVGKIPPEKYQILQAQGMMKIADLFKVRQNSSTYNESGDHRTVFYAESGMVMHYLYDHNLIPKLADYFSLKIDKKVPVEDAIQQSFGMSAAQFDKALRAYVDSNRYLYYSIPTPPNIVSKDYSVKPLTVADSNAVIADIHLHSRDYQKQALAEFQEILKTDPDNAAACRGLGYAYLQARDFQQASEYFKRAARLNSKDPRVHYYSAMLLNREDSSDPTVRAEMTKELETAIALDPGFGDAYVLLAYTQARNGDNAAAMLSMRKAITLSPRNLNYRFDLAQMYLSNGQPDKTIEILQVLQKSQDQEVAARATMLLSQAKEVEASMRSASAPEVSGIEKSPPTNAIAPQASRSPVKFLKGTVVSVDCSAAPSATITVASGSKTWKMQVSDTKHVLVLGTDAFSCSWNKQKVALNYRQDGDTAGSVVSIEVQ